MHLESDDVFGAESEIDAGQSNERLGKETGPDEEHDGQGNFGDHKAATHPTASALRTSVAGPGSQGVDDVGARRLQCRREPEE